MDWNTFIYYFSFLYPTVLIMGILCAFDVILKGRSSQGIVAWSICLIVFPFISIPFYLVFGGRKFHGYVKARRRDYSELKDVGVLLLKNTAAYSIDSQETCKKTLAKMARLPITSGNQVQLLINGEATFSAIYEELEKAKEYILIQYYMVRHDQIGQALKDRLIKKAKEGIKVFFIYDAIGSYELSNKYLKELENGGVSVAQFGSYRFVKNKFQLNFRNHRKVIVVDGNTAFSGGLNIGDEYLGLDKELSPWRDTHLLIKGPAALCVQLVFLEDWYSMTGNKPGELNWQARNFGKTELLALPTGPADELDNSTHAFIAACNSAKERIWLSSPYFVPPPEVSSALQLAAQRGVDVRVIVPDKADNPLVQLSSQCFIDIVSSYDVKFYRYKKGFLHQKAFLIDDDIAVVGTANLDMRSFSLNFELMIYAFDKEIASQVEEMLLQDFEASDLIPGDEFSKRSFAYQLLAKFCRLLAPLQ